MSLPEPARPHGETTHPSAGAPLPTSALGTLAWVGVVVVGALLALLVLSWLGPVGGQ